ncbi:DUF503 domain-containing protein [Brevibacillus fluminis]|uniref:DUF503 domain-containing protein n=1 Tax=Brevibacillus fluminis TaxID=511487 RepID=A0A3M8DV81_9BACL|nr:DUF503 domain-containing protein [Brevibacillus fluminis]RNB91834.1 DUF503 domain-containing protein [Brevibacillus fluminis]
MVGTVRLELHIAHSQSLKDKRAVVKSLISQLRNKFNVSAAETAYLEQWQRTEIVVAAVDNEMAFLQKELNAVVRLVEIAPGVELIAVDTDYCD